MATSLLKTTNEQAGSSLLEKFWKRKEHPTDMWGIAPFGIPTLDMLTGGIQEHWLIFLGARPQVGKSVLAGQIALNVARYFHNFTNRVKEEIILIDPVTGEEHVEEQVVIDPVTGEGMFKPKSEWKYVKIITFEMSAQMYMQRLACAEANVPSMKVNAGTLNDIQAGRFTEAVTSIMELPVVYWDKSGSIKAVEAFLRDREMQTGFWILDHIGLFSDVKSNTQFQTGAITTASHACQTMAYEIAPGMVIAHMNRESEKNADKRPTLANFSGADGIGKDADLALGLHRPWMFADISEEERASIQPAELLMLKSRHNASWNIQMTYNPRLTKFIETPEANEGAKELMK